MRGKPSRPARLKGVAEDNSLMAEVVDDVEIEMGGISKKNQVFVANILIVSNPMMYSLYCIIVHIP